ncbi:putative 3-phosphoinositide-dependent protein kinase B [Blattamonas nauphoetae]|uniref:non-specific serine/threonine protein kinase n=1 Tax=Blattamonas nauphoetae TaxID=2049346 RepID=A0ABQ9YA18_9EUKA|nr:putative 3-phosphoinositide-dependent protein kinase B [Blattamonas nauphoetae]
MGQETSKRSDFTVLKELGKGSYGTVELLEHNVTKKTFACKSARLSTSQKALESIEAEIEAYKDLNNPFILKYYYSFKEDQIFYMMTEYCSRKDLAVFYNDSREMGATVPPERTWKFIYQTLIGLDYLLKKRIAHGDIKPENVFLMENLDVRIGDFGSKQDAEATFTDLDKANGTEAFYSPQRRFYDDSVKKASYGLSDDLWALGVAIYFLHTKKLPFVTQKVPNLKIQSSVYKLTDADADVAVQDFTYFVLDTNSFTRPTTQDLLLSPHFTALFKNSDEGLKKFYTTDADFSIRQESPNIVYNSDLPQPFRDYVGYILETFGESFSSQIASSAQFVHFLPLLDRKSLLSHPDFPFSIVHNSLTTPSQTSINESSFLSSFIYKSKTLISQFVAVLSDLVDHFTRPQLDATFEFVDKPSNSPARSKDKNAQQPEPKVIKYKLKHVHLHLFHTLTALPFESFLTILHSTNLISLLTKILAQHRSSWMVKNPFFVKSALSLVKSYLMKFENSLLLPEITHPAQTQSWNCSFPQQLLRQAHHFVALLHTGLNKAFCLWDVNKMVWTTNDTRKLREEQQALVINIEIADLLLDSERVLKKTSSLHTSGAHGFTPLAENRLAQIENFARSSIALTDSQFRSSTCEADFDQRSASYPWKVTHNSIVHVGLTPQVLIQIHGQRVMKQLGKKDVVGESNTIIHLIRWIQDAIVWRDKRRQTEWDRPVVTSVESLTRKEKDEYASLLHETLCSYATLLNEQSVEEIEEVWESVKHHFVAIVGRVIGSVLNSLSQYLIPDWMNVISQPLSVFPTLATPPQNSFSSPSFPPSYPSPGTQSPVMLQTNFHPINQVPPNSTQQSMNLPYQPQNPQFQQPNYAYQNQQFYPPQQLPNPMIVHSHSASAPTPLNGVPPPTIMQTVRANQMPIQHVPPPTLISTVQASQFPPSHVPPPTIVGTVRGNPMTNSPVPQPNTFGLGFQSPPSPMPTSPVVAGHYNPHAVQHSPLQNTFTTVQQTSPGFQTMQGNLQQNHQYTSNTLPRMGGPTGMTAQIPVQTPSITSLAPSMLIPNYITLPTTQMLSVSTPFLALLSHFFEKAQSSTQVMSSLAPLFAFMCRCVTIIVRSINRHNVAAPMSAETRSCLYQLLSSLLSCLTQFMKQPQITQNSPAAQTTPQFILFTQTIFDDFNLSIAKLPELSQAWANRNTSPSFRPLSKRDAISDEAAESFNSFVTNYVSFVSAFSQFSSFFEEAMKQNNAFVNSFLNKTPSQQTTLRNSLTNLLDLAKKMSADCSESILTLHPTLRLAPFSSSPLHLEGGQVSPLAHRYYVLKCFGDSIHTTATQCLLYLNCLTGSSPLTLMDSLSSFLLSEDGHAVSNTLAALERLCTTSGAILAQTNVWSNINTALTSSFPQSAFQQLLQLLSVWFSSQPPHIASFAKQQLPSSTILSYANSHTGLLSQSDNSLLSQVISSY